jgi:hypothetical protein
VRWGRGNCLKETGSIFSRSAGGAGLGTLPFFCQSGQEDKPMEKFCHIEYNILIWNGGNFPPTITAKELFIAGDKLG